MALQFQRNADVYIECMDTTRTSTLHTWKLPVLEGFSFSQAVNSSEITVNEAGETSRRARLLFNDSLAPAEWSFSTYIRPTSVKDEGTSPGVNVTVAPEQVMWAMLMGAKAFTPEASPRNAAGVFSNDTLSPGIVNRYNADSPRTNENTFNFDASNLSAMPDNWNIVFAFEDGTNKQYFRMNKAVVNSASIDFDIDGIATCAWSGFAVDLEDLNANSPATPSNLATAITDGNTGSENFIRNRISTVSLTRTDGSPVNDAYSIILTGGSFSVENNITYLTPEELANVNTPLANITGARTITGTLNCYFDNDQANSKSGELFADLVADTTTIRNDFDMAINIGGETAGTPRLALDVPTAHLEIPVINVEDLLTLEVTYHGQVANGNVDSTNEATIIYKS